MHLKELTPEEARRLADKGAILVDIREADEVARENIPGARHAPLSGMGDAAARLDDAPAVIFFCRSGNRTRENSGQLRQLADAEAYVLQGGFDAWRKAGLPVNVDRRQPLPLMRQVQMAAGLLIVLGVALGYALSPWWFLLAGFVGAGLFQAGATGWCGMARLLGVMPWNRRSPAGA
ncbi:rhodanese family protein [Minwuia thermotolerans]|uniref:Rhodanese domain-containing protein n=1 Tax=Minwuia thermotolerans TaxID=2056226 RepID=A0A2M9FVK2_9PROT|nr:rhodanese family protein [Minwuia thermotolerans]PJK27464.1 hypothetical protein CVT23_21305 [Minwuia thermotolerans]